MHNWREYLPDEYRHGVAIPVRYEEHDEPSLNAHKVVGFDIYGRRCYLSHRFELTETAFDVDEFPLEVVTYRERVVAWRLGDGRWLRLKAYADRPDHCTSAGVRLPPEITDEMSACR